MGDKKTGDVLATLHSGAFHFGNGALGSREGGLGVVFHHVLSLPYCTFISTGQGRVKLYLK